MRSKVHRLPCLSRLLEISWNSSATTTIRGILFPLLRRYQTDYLRKGGLIAAALRLASATMEFSTSMAKSSSASSPNAFTCGRYSGESGVGAMGNRVTPLFEIKQIEFQLVGRIPGAQTVDDIFQQIRFTLSDRAGYQCNMSLSLIRANRDINRLGSTQTQREQ